jgi:hypothetical protein
MVQLKDRGIKHGPPANRPPLDAFWVSWLGRTFAQNPELNPGEVAKYAKEWAEEHGRNDPPARATVYKYHNAYSSLPESARQAYRQFVWPDSMAQGLIPWEASRAALDLLKWTNQHELPPPTVGIVSWFWRVAMALPEASLTLRLRVALTLATHVEGDRPIPAELSEWITNNTVPADYRYRIITGGAAASWAVELSSKMVSDRKLKADLYDVDVDSVPASRFADEQ